MNYTSIRDFFQGPMTNVNSVTVMCMDQAITADTSLLGFCRGSASVPRGFVSVELGAETESQCDNTATVVDTSRGAPLMGDQCDFIPHV